MPLPPNILTIAGSDSGGGAGIQADLKTISMLGGFGMSVITALTAQNSLGVTGIEAPTPGFVGLQLSTVLEDFPVHAAKTGMLFSAPIIEAVAKGLDGKSFPLVVDPVCVSQSGHALLQEDAVDALRRRMLPLADLLTPNRPEAELLSGIEIKDRDSLFLAGARLLGLGAKAVLVKGGHFEERESGRGSVSDWLFAAGREPREFPQPRVRTSHTHGTGCALSAAIATGLGQGLLLAQAVIQAQEHLNLALRAGYGPGKGYGPPNHLAVLERAKAGRAILEELEEASARLSRVPSAQLLVPEVRMNLARALPWAAGPEDVAAFTGRISCDNRGRFVFCGPPAFGASSHIARVLLAAMAHNPDVRAVAACRLNDKTREAMERNGMVLAWFDRADESEETQDLDGGTMEWGTARALATANDPGAVDAVCDLGGPGKEPVARILGRDALDVVDKLARISVALRL
ncbi:bifunctional hydroxymethylpyrimidine kinase/phosphomethylpyrimidine kinase [Desulfocurvus sp. DL9XJH121]